MKIKCATCGKEFNVSKKATHCKACRTKHWASKNPDKAPAKGKPKKKRPQKPRPARPIVEQALAVVEPASQMQKSLSRAASMGQRSSLLTVAKSSGRSSRSSSNIKAINLLTSFLLKPDAAQARPIKFYVDESSIPKKGMTFTSTFCVRSNNMASDFKVMWLPSPIVVAQIYSPTEDDLTITGARYISIPAEKGGTMYYVVGNKVGFVGVVDEQFIFTPREDFAKYRVMALAGQAKWFGKAINMNGTIYGSRITNKDDLVDFDLLSKPDSVITNMDGTVIVIGQNIEPVYKFDYVDDNDDEDPDPVTEARITEEINISFAGSSAGALSHPVYTERTDRPTTTGDINKASFIKHMADNILARGDSEALNGLGAALIRKYGSAFFTVGDDGRYKLNQDCDVQFSVVKVVQDDNRFETFDNVQVADSFNPDELPPSTFFAGLVSNLLVHAVRDRLFDRLPTFPIKTQVYTSCSFLLRIVLKGTQITGRHRSMAKIPTSIIPDIVEGHDQLTHMGHNIRCPVVQFQAEQPFLQFQHVVFEELVIEDDSILTLDAIATNDESNQALSVSLPQFRTLSKALASMPPLLMCEKDMLGQVAQQEMANRGILTTIAGLLGPIAGAIFPPVAALLPTINQIAGAVDGMLG